MIPPFLAAYGVYTENKTIVEEAFQQVRLYRDLLRDERTGLWRHMVMGENPDSGFYATGEPLQRCVSVPGLSLLSR